jgi:hypothetical protein
MAILYLDLKFSNSLLFLFEFCMTGFIFSSLALNHLNNLNSIPIFRCFPSKYQAVSYFWIDLKMCSCQCSKGASWTKIILILYFQICYYLGSSVERYPLIYQNFQLILTLLWMGLMLFYLFLNQNFCYKMFELIISFFKLINFWFDPNLSLQYLTAYFYSTL